MSLPVAIDHLAGKAIGPVGYGMMGKQQLVRGNIIPIFRRS